MSLPLELTIPYVPNMSVNARLAPSSGGGFRLSDEYRQAKAHAVEHVLIGSSGHSPTEEPVSVHLRCFWPDRRGRDADGPVKLICDALQGYVIEDDDQVQKVCSEKCGVDEDEPRIEVQVETHS